MIKVFFCLMLIGQAAHATTINLKAGESIQIRPNQEVTVVCEDDSATFKRYCVCEASGRGHILYLQNTEAWWDRSKLDSFLGASSGADCNARLDSHPSCQ